MNKAICAVALCMLALSFPAGFSKPLLERPRIVEKQYNIGQSGMPTGQGSIVRIAFEEFSATPTVTTPSNLTVQFDYPTNGGTGIATATLICKSVDEIVLEDGYHKFTCHLDGDIHTGDGELDDTGQIAVRVFAPLGWASGGGDVSEEVNSADGNENYLRNTSGVANEKPTHHWDSRPFQIQTGEFFVDSIVTHRYGIHKVEHRIAGVTDWTNATLTHKPGPTIDAPWIPVWRSTLDANAVNDTFEGGVEVRVTPARGDAGSILTSSQFSASKRHDEWSHADFFHPHETNLPVILNADSTLQVTPIYAAVERDESGGTVSTTEAGALTDPFPTIEDAKIAIRNYRNAQGWSSNVTAGVIVLKEGKHFLGTLPQDHWNAGSSVFVTNDAFMTIRAASGVDPTQTIITNAPFVVRVPPAKNPDATGFIRIVDPGVGNQAKLEIAPTSSTVTEFLFGTGTGQYATVAALVAAINAAGFEAVEILTGIETKHLKFATYDFTDQQQPRIDDRTHFRMFEINRATGGVNVRRLLLTNLTTHTSEVLSGTSNPTVLMLDATRHVAHAQSDSGSDQVARGGKFLGGIWAYSPYFENINVVGTGWAYVRDAHFVRVTDALKRCTAAVNPLYEDCGIIEWQGTHPDLHQWFMNPTQDEDEEEVPGIDETLVFNLLHLNGDASDLANDAQPIFFTAETGGTYRRVSVINYQWNEIDREQAFKGNYDGLLLLHLSPLQGGVRKWLHEGFATTTSRYENLSIRNTACEVLHLSGRNQQGPALQGDLPSLWSVLNEVHIRSTLEDAEGTLTIALYPDATSGEDLTELFTNPGAGDLSPNEATTTQPHLFDRPTNVPLLWPYDAKGTERISDGTGAIGALERQRLVDFSSYSITIGTHVSGGLAELESSDDTYLKFQSAQAGVLHQAEIELTGTTDVESPRRMFIRVESRLNTTGATGKVRLKLPGTSTFITIEQFSMGTTDALQSFEVPDFDDYIDSNGTIVMRILYEKSAISGLTPFEASIDLVEIEIQ